MAQRVQIAFTTRAEQVAVLTQAAKAGEPFCEACFAKAVGNFEMPSSSTFGVLDLARAAKLWEQVHRLAPLQARRLYLEHGKLHQELVRHCPHLVELAPGGPLTELWPGEGWSQSWDCSWSPLPGCTGLAAAAPFHPGDAAERVGTVLVRFWDPRVFRVYIPLVEPGQLGEGFQEVEAYVAESEDGKGAIRYAVKGGALQIA